MYALILQQPGNAQVAGLAAASVLVFVILVAVGLGIYFLPTILGWKKQNRNAILALNLLLGITGIGWIVALVWALSKDAQPTVVVVPESIAKK